MKLQLFIWLKQISTPHRKGVTKAIYHKFESMKILKLRPLNLIDGQMLILPNPPKIYKD